MRLRFLAVSVAALALSAGCGKLNDSVAPEGSVTLVDSLQSGNGPMSATDRRTFVFPGGDWSSRVAWEARYALSSSATGSSRWPVSADAWGPRWLADWCYTNNMAGEGNDPHALGKAKEESFGYVGTIGHNPSTSHHYSGWCTFFVRLVLYRSSYWAGYGSHLTTPNFGAGSMYDWCNSRYMTQDYASARSGWIAAKPPPGEHIAILDRRETINGRDGWWFIDGNYVGSMLIGRHFMPMSELRAKGYWMWNPSLATPN